jgi:uncharacterized protein YjhX (UPF0386 family)
MKKSKFYNRIILLFITISTLACNAQKYDNINKCNLNIFKNKKYTILKESLKDTTYSITPAGLLTPI